MAVIVFGSINTDIGLGVRHLPVPGETVLTGGYALVPGGKGCNQAVAMAKLGADVRMIGAVGDDVMAGPPMAAMQAAGIDTARVRIAERPTGLAAVMVAEDGENAIVVASGANLSVRADQLANIRAGDVLVCQMEVPFEETAAALVQAKAAGAVTVLNLAPFGELPAEAWGAVDYWVVNELEAAALAAQVGVAATDDYPALARALALRLNATVVATLGGEGAVAVTAAGDMWRASVLPVEIVDTTGAGDAFVGGMAAALAEGDVLSDALKKASATAGLACTGFGAQTALPGVSDVAEASTQISVQRL